MKKHRPGGIPTAMVPVKELGLQTKVQALQSLFVTLAASLHPIVVHGDDGLEVIDTKMGTDVRSSIQMAMVHTCNRIADFMLDNRNWDSGQGAENILGALMKQAVEEMEGEKPPPTKPKRPRRKKGPESDDQK